jgi:long-chain acyl-CoA synthetase
VRKLAGFDSPATEKMSRSATPPDETNAAILEPWLATLASRRDEPAIFGNDGSILRTFGSIEEEADAFAGELDDIPAGTVVAVEIGNSPSWPAVFLALLRTKCVVVPLGRDASLPEYVEVVIEEGGCIRRLENPTRQRVQADTVLLKLTSGTTGTPRGICFTAAQLAADCANICETMGIHADDVNYGVIPFAHSYGFSNLITPLLLEGVRLVASEDRMPRAILNGLRQTGATVFPGTPVLFQHLARLEQASLENVRVGISAGAPLSRALWREVHEATGLKLHTFYGASECGGIAYDREGIVLGDGFVGEPMANVEVAVSEGGEIEVRSSAVGAGYFPTPDDETLGDGRYRPADLANKTEDGLILVGRVSDFINVGGRKLNPAEVERQLAGFPGVQQVIVFGVESRLRGEEPIACVVGQVDVPAMMRFAGNALPAWQVPKDIWPIAELPVSERGKISRRTLAERYQQQPRRPPHE